MVDFELSVWWGKIAVDRVAAADHATLETNSSAKALPNQLLSIAYLFEQHINSAEVHWESALPLCRDINIAKSELKSWWFRQLQRTWSSDHGAHPGPCA